MARLLKFTEICVQLWHDLNAFQSRIIRRYVSKFINEICLVGHTLFDLYSTCKKIFKVVRYSQLD